MSPKPGEYGSWGIRISMAKWHNSLRRNAEFDKFRTSDVAGFQHFEGGFPTRTKAAERGVRITLQSKLSNYFKVVLKVSSR